MKTTNRLQNIKDLLKSKTHLMPLDIKVSEAEPDQFVVDVVSATPRQVDSIRNILNAFGLHHVRVRCTDVVEAKHKQAKP